MLFRSCRLLLLIAVLLPASGCESGTDKLAPVTGRVLYRGSPLLAGTVVFSPDLLRGTHGTLARAEIQPDGTYTLRTGDALGAAVGWHHISVAAIEPTPAADRLNPIVMPRSLLPDKYRDPELSGLVCEVRGGDDNRIDINLD
jgi:hypothetical protein